ncbi:type IV pilus modification protein PilV [Ralstonia sp. SET104]|uniref:type IV pilus modification protein PilV n=1 Tax=Ralstonia sp. SET104 TaxID=2448774 RepID=UPI000F58D260|nr:type IV pilus modification protein PilV [Ralstonia sp. SET104]GCB06644.1 hypothetical protein PSUB009319_42750 [Ralstonia sp. SET104]
MLTSGHLAHKCQRGLSLLEVLVTILILAIGLLGLAGLLSKVYVAEMESNQRAQAVLVLREMTERMTANRAQAASYVTASPIGTADSQPTSCTGIAAGPNRDLCEWSNTLKGAAENNGSAKSGAMVGARGCITQLQAPDPTLGICTPAIYQVAVAWQGMNPTTAPAITCAQGQYGTPDTSRRLIAAQISVGLPSCY